MLPNHCPLFTELCWVPDMPAAGLTSPHAAILMMLQGNACFAESHAVAQPVLTACGTFLRLSDPIPVPHRLTFPAFLYVFLTKTRLKPPSPCEGVSNVPWETDATAAAGLSIAMAWRRRKPTAVSLLLTTLWKIKSEASSLDWSESQAEIVSSRWAALGRMGAIGGWTTIWQHFHRQSWTTSSCFHLFLHVDTCTYKQWGHWVGSDPKPGLWALSEDQRLIQSHVLLSAVCYSYSCFSSPQNRQAYAWVKPAKTASLVRTSFAMHWEQGSRGDENLTSNIYTGFESALRSFQVLFARTNTFQWSHSLTQHADA